LVRESSKSSGSTPAAQHLVVEGANVEFRAQFLLRSVAKLAELELAQFVRKRLGRP